MFFVSGGFHLQGAYFIFPRDQKIHFVVVSGCRVHDGMVKQFIPRCGKDLRHHIFVQITKIRGKLVTKQFLIDFILGKIPL